MKNANNSDCLITDIRGGTVYLRRRIGKNQFMTNSYIRKSHYLDKYTESETTVEEFLQGKNYKKALQDKIEELQEKLKTEIKWNINYI